MELSSIIHIMDETFAYKLSEHKYVIKLITKRNDCTKVSLAFLEKYFREKNFPVIPSDTFYIEMDKVAETNNRSYYEAIISDEIILANLNERAKKYLEEHKNLNKFQERIIEECLSLNEKRISMLSLAYYFILENDEEIKYFGNYKFFNQEPHDNVLDMFNLVFHQANASYFSTPLWSKGATMYQIFPERYAARDDKYFSEWFNEPMEYHVRTNGSLKGITQKIPYLKELGIDCIYLTPIFLANTSHRYDTIDYMEIDPVLGSKEEFKELVEELHKANIKIILDLVFNHSSTNFFAFVDLLKNQENSQYKDWYFIEKFPVDFKMPSDYMGFSFSPFMPKLNTSNKECRKYLLGVTRYYLEEFDVDGYRLDVANEVTHDFWIEFRKVCKKIKDDCLIMGEVWYDSRTYLRGNEFDSIMNYTYYDAIRGVLKNKYTIDQFASILSRERGESSLTYYHNSNLLVGSHDTNRIYYELNHHIDKFKQAMAMLFTLPGSPILYYGDEKMMDGAMDPDCRRGMIFDEKYHSSEFAFVKKLIKLKHQKSFKIGDLKIIEDQEYLSYLRFSEDEKYLVIFNLKEKDIKLDKYKGYVDLINEIPFDGNLKSNQVLIFEV